MGKSEVRRMIDQRKCVICGELLSGQKEINQCLCGDCYHLRRAVKKFVRNVMERYVRQK